MNGVSFSVSSPESGSAGGVVPLSRLWFWQPDDARAIRNVPTRAHRQRSVDLSGGWSTQTPLPAPYCRACSYRLRAGRRTSQTHSSCLPPCLLAHLLRLPAFDSNALTAARSAYRHWLMIPLSVLTASMSPPAAVPPPGGYAVASRRLRRNLRRDGSRPRRLAVVRAELAVRYERRRPGTSRSPVADDHTRHPSVLRNSHSFPGQASDVTMGRVGRVADLLGFRRCPESLRTSRDLL